MVTTTRTQLALTALLALGVAASTSCGKERQNNGIRPTPKDAMTSGDPDGGTTTPDSGDDNADGGNNNNTDGGNNNNTDGGNNNDDGGNNNTDGGNNNNTDAGMEDSGPPPPECAVDTDCAAPNTHCLGFDQASGSLVQCVPGGQCACFQGCDPWVAVDQSGCPRPMEACGRAGGMSPTPGVCLADTGGGTQGQACTSMFVGEDYNGDSCNGAQNYICNGSDPLDVAGTCVRLCDTANGALCTSLDPQSQCMALPGGGTLGVCVAPITDLGTACQDPSMCQGGHCSQEIGGQCSFQCGLSNVCPQAGGICIGAQGLSPLCAVECTPGAAGDTMCSGINAGLICEDLGEPGNPFPLCWPRCDDTTNPCQAPMTCNAATGHCQ